MMKKSDFKDAWYVIRIFMFGYGVFAIARGVSAEDEIKQILGAIVLGIWYAFTIKEEDNE